MPCEVYLRWHASSNTWSAAAANCKPPNPGCCWKICFFAALSSSFLIKPAVLAVWSIRRLTISTFVLFVLCNPVAVDDAAVAGDEAPSLELTMLEIHADFKVTCSAAVMRFSYA